MIAFFARHPTAANLLMVLFVLLGALGLLDLRRETFPEFTADRVTVTVAYPGASAQTIDETIVQRVEDAVDGIEYLEKLTSAAQEGVATITLEMEDGADLTEFKADVSSAVDAITDLPADAEDPIVAESSRSTLVASIAVTGPMSAPDLKLYCEDLKRELRRYDEVSQVEVAGFSTHQLQIRLKQAAAAQYGLSVADLGDLISAQSLDLPVGALDTADGEIRIRYDGQRYTVEDFATIPVVANAAGGEVPLGELAEILDTFELEEEKLLFNGERAGMLRVSKTSTQDALRILDAIEDFVAKQSAAAPPGVRFIVTENAAAPIAERLTLLLTNGLQGLVLVFLTLWLFFNTRLALWVAAGLPVSFLGGLWIMARIGYTLNMMTMMALLLALGLLMDDGIVLADNVAVHLRRGKSALAAAVDGVYEVRTGILSSFLTTICVFVPLSFLDGQIGRVLLVIPVVLIAVMAISLVEAFCILPNHLGHSLAGYDLSKQGALRRRFDDGFEAFRERVVGPLVDAAVRARYLTLGAALGLFLLSLGLFAGGVLKFEGFPATDGDVVEFRLRLPAGTSLARTEAEVQRAVLALERVNATFKPAQPREQDLVRNVTVRYNYNPDSPDAGAHVATVQVDLLSVEERATTISEFTSAWRAETGPLADATAARYTSTSSGPGGAAIELRAQGRDLEQLSAAGQELRRWFDGFEGVFDLNTDLEPGTPQVRVRLRPGALGTSAQGTLVAQQLRAAFSGVTPQDVQAGAEDYEVMVMLDETGRDTLADLEYFELQLGGGRRVPLGAVADIELDRSYAKIARERGARTVTVTGDIDTQLANASELMRRFRAELLPELTTRYPALQFEIGGQTEESGKTARSMLTALGTGLFGVFFLLSFQFRSYLEPLVVMLAIPLALIGVLWGNVLLGDSLTLPGILGFISLAGVVVNDSILLMVFIKQGVAAGESPGDAARMASRARLRAIILTSATTAAGLIPLLFERSQQAQTLIPVATSIVFGILASTLLLLVVLPAMYAILGDLGLTAAREHAHDEPEGPR
ncbi:MAG: efflux RND transporter permease subunit [Myxococcales bacterium]|nr:efflux RND transporter permease subunit [Myxococcales bacterium]